jgi:hypothetical protein
MADKAEAASPLSILRLVQAQYEMQQASSRHAPVLFISRGFHAALCMQLVECTQSFFEGMTELEHAQLLLSRYFYLVYGSLVFVLQHSSTEEHFCFTRQGEESTPKMLKLAEATLQRLAKEEGLG